MPVFDAPAQAIPAHARQGILDIVEPAGRQQEPLDGFGVRWRRWFAHMHHPQRDGEFVVLACGRAKSHGEVTQFDLRGTRLDLVARFLPGPFWARTLAFDGQQELALERALPDRLEQPEVAVISLAVT